MQISLDVITKSNSHFKYTIYFKFIIIIALDIIIKVFIVYNNTIFINKDFLFKSDCAQNLKFIDEIFAHIVNVIILII